MTKKLLHNAIVHMALAIAAGMLLGYFFPSIAAQMKPLSDGFLRLIGMLIGVLIFCLVVSGIAGLQNRLQATQVGVKAIIYFEAMTLVSLMAGIVGALLLQPGKGFAPGFASGVSNGAVQPALQVPPAESTADFLLDIIPSTFAGAFTGNSSLQVLLLALLTGIALGRSGERGRDLLALMEAVQQVLHGMVAMVLKLAPLAALGAVAFVIGRYGLSSVLPLLQFVAAIYLVSILFVCIVMGLVARAAGCNIFRLIAYVKEELLLVVFTSSSMAALPGLVEKMEKIGCAKAVVRLVLPTGYSFNLSGTNIYIAMAALFLAQASHVELGVWQLLSLLGVSLLTSKSATSVAGSAFVALAATLASLNIIPVAGIVLLLGVERLMKCRSLTNVIGNCVACVVVCAWEKSLDRRAMHQALSGKAVPPAPSAADQS
ncbi:aerobic C4-dicarboxylate transport protein [Polaromonas sp. YR568]|uniref:cation:dicarboxylate symporter family transporter n=1 Tax=Polaromonas sp. YR568 TaxID=1855301 RepID=UPI0008F4494D|nr:cation:dicarboxylase symporter family transporter [Polaromonas sp. YR568]SFU80507.1 aerobic C4-dicarboxylate transport protein [Polaromonas sp. YR568]